ncbi:MAG: Gfo/Idh/MocA family oxidoreductase [Actinomyces urogenitalis]|uniref:Gfo/Idh/MocA family protein n=1 Tax=Actinomyces urogenitalis TaxID=103621 RepID=UPI002430CAB4|nr:Gfo/Idh/MocA family oxidoreductase [Actinomyces urogenitalis]MBS5976740.1 Gfo/Idh/MocA family oxidoreductase [Actinomyces urogenitalis]
MTVRIGLVGAGGMGRAHLARIHNDLAGGKITAVADIVLDAARSAAEPYGAKAYDNSEALINDPEVDAVVIATFGKVHAPDVIKCIEAGKYVLCEKPLATTAEDCLAIMEAEQKAGKKLVTVGFMRRFDAAYNEMKAVLDKGDNGEALLVHNRHRNPSVPESYTSRMAIDDTAIHEIDTMRWLLGEEITEVRVDRPKLTTRRFDHLIDPVVVVMRTESGVLIDDEVNVNLEYGYSIECELVLENAAVRLGDQEKIFIRDIHGDRNAMCQSHIDRFQAAFNTEFQSWINAVDAGEHTGSTSWDGYAATAVVDAAVESLENDGKVVKVALVERPAFYA